MLATSAVRFALTGLYQLTAGSGWKEVAGLAGIVLCAIAAYAAAALLIEDARGSTVLPVGRRAVRGVGDPRRTGRPSFAGSSTRPASAVSSS